MRHVNVTEKTVFSFYDVLYQNMRRPVELHSRPNASIFCNFQILAFLYNLIVAVMAMQKCETVTMRK